MPPHNKVSRKTFMAIHKLEAKGIEPIDYLNEVYIESMAAYRAARGLSEKGDSGPGYLQAAFNAAKALASFKYPTLTAMAIKDMTDDDKKTKPMSMAEAVEIIKNDPFCPPEIKKELDTVEILPLGQQDELKK